MIGVGDDMIGLGGCEAGDGESRLNFLGTRLAVDSMLLLDSSKSLEESLDSPESLSSSEGALLREFFLSYFAFCFFSRLNWRTAAADCT